MQYYHIEYTSPLFTRAFDNIADVMPMCLGHFEPSCTSPNVRRQLCAARRWFLETKHRETISRHALKFREAWRLLAELLGHGGAAQICLSRKHREAIESLVG